MHFLTSYNDSNLNFINLTMLMIFLKNQARVNEIVFVFSFGCTIGTTFVGDQFVV